MRQQAQRVVCDNCKHAFLVRSLDIKECSVRISGKQLQLVYFACPECNQIYRICLEDAKVQELRADLDRVKARIRKNAQSDEESRQRLFELVQVKHRKLERYMTNLNKRYSGTFTFVASENKQKEVVYNPTVGNTRT